MQTTRTGSGSVPWVNIYDLDAGACGFVADHPLQLGETPLVDASRLAVLPNPAQVFKDGDGIGDIGVNRHWLPGVTDDRCARLSRLNTEGGRPRTLVAVRGVEGQRKVDLRAACGRRRRRNSSS